MTVHESPTSGSEREFPARAVTGASNQGSVACGHSTRSRSGSSTQVWRGSVVVGAPAGRAPTPAEGRGPGIPSNRSSSRRQRARSPLSAECPGPLPGPTPRPAGAPETGPFPAAPGTRRASSPPSAQLGGPADRPGRLAWCWTAQQLTADRRDVNLCPWPGRRHADQLPDGPVRSCPAAIRLSLSSERGAAWQARQQASGARQDCPLPGCRLRHPRRGERPRGGACLDRRDPARRRHSYPLCGIIFRLEDE